MIGAWVPRQPLPAWIGAIAYGLIVGAAVLALIRQRRWKKRS